jgi:formate/nitrite transporter FocA (FNT family)
MVTSGVVLPYTAHSVVGSKAISTFVPIYMFFAMGFEYMVVNQFIIPTARLLGAPISMYDFWVGNQIPVTIGNFLGGSCSPAPHSVGSSTQLNLLRRRAR